MDSRSIAANAAVFLNMLENAFQQKNKLYLLFDENGINRLEGHVTSIEKSEDSIFVEFNENQKLELKSIVAINGNFLDEYGEC